MTVYNIPGSVTNDRGLGGFLGRARRALARQDITKAMPAPGPMPVADVHYETAMRQSQEALDGMARILDLYREQLRNGETQPAGAEAEMDLYAELMERRSSVVVDHAWDVALERRFDNLYYAETIQGDSGADHWPEGRLPGRAHVSDNVPATYVDVPAALQAIEPVFNYVAKSASKDDRAAAERAERLYFQWRAKQQLALTEYDLCRTKGLYGTGWVKVAWDEAAAMPRVSNIDTPSDLWVGWGSSDYKVIDWAAYCYTMSAESAQRTYGVSVEGVERNGLIVPWVFSGDHSDPLSQRGREDTSRPRPANLDVEIIDYWYFDGKGTVHNAIFAGAHQVKPPTAHPEYDRLPYVPVHNGRVNGRPKGKSDLYDVEQILREKDGVLSAISQMVYRVTGGQMWQLIGTEAPEGEVPPNVVPTPNGIVAPGPGNQIVPIQPWFPELQVESYLDRLDREAAAITGLNDLLLGLAPAQVLSSSKAVAALVANYESRLAPKRAILYAAYAAIWEMAAKVWASHDREVRAVIGDNYRLDIEAPELTPRDSLETASMAMQLVQQRIWSMERAMDATGVDDTGDEKSIIREEQTDASLNPAAVQAMAQLMAAFKTLGQAPPAQAEQQAIAQAQALTQAQTQATAQAQERPVRGSQSNNAPENKSQGQSPLLAQSMLQNGQASGRILSQEPLG